MRPQNRDWEDFTTVRLWLEDYNARNSITIRTLRPAPDPTWSEPRRDIGGRQCDWTFDWSKFHYKPQSAFAAVLDAGYHSHWKLMEIYSPSIDVHHDPPQVYYRFCTPNDDCLKLGTADGKIYPSISSSLLTDKRAAHDYSLSQSLLMTECHN